MPGRRRLLAARREAQRRQRVLHRVPGRPSAGRGQLAADLAADLLDLGEARRPREGAGEPRREAAVGQRPVAARSRLRRDRPLVARTAARLGHGAPLEQPGLGEPLELEPHRVRVPPDALGELLGRGRAEQLAEDRHELDPHGLGEDVARRLWSGCPRIATNKPTTHFSQ